MDFAIFPAPKCSYSLDEQFLGKLIFIPKIPEYYPYYPSKKFDESCNLEDDDDTTMEIDIKSFQTKLKQKLDRDTDLITFKAQKRTKIKDYVLPPSSQQTSLKNVLTNQKIYKSIPCLYTKSRIKQPNIILFFHSNAVDIKMIQQSTYKLVNQLQISALVVEYPGYGLYQDHDNKAATIDDDAKYIYTYLVNKVGYKEKNILVFGRSIGTGPATYVASLFNPACLILMSPFTSVRNVVKFLLHKFLALLLDERFDNLKRIEQVVSPIFILHGKKDEIVPVDHSYQLKETAKISKAILLKISETMDHENYNFMNDLIRPLVIFLDGLGFEFEGEPELNFPPETNYF